MSYEYTTIVKSTWDDMLALTDELFISKNGRKYLEGSLRLAKRRRDYWRERIHDALERRDMETYHRITRKYTQALNEVIRYEHKLEHLDRGKAKSAKQVEKLGVRRLRGWRKR